MYTGWTGIWFCMFATGAAGYCKVCDDFMRYALKTIIKLEIGWKARNVITRSSVLRVMVRAWCSIPKSAVGRSASEFSDLGQLTQVHSSLLVEWLVCLAQACWSGMFARLFEMFRWMVLLRSAHHGFKFPATGLGSSPAEFCGNRVGQGVFMISSL